MEDDAQLKKLVNASGFAFQLGIEHEIRREEGHAWRVTSREHPWSLGGSEGFIDLVLSLGTVTGVVECKRTRGATWVFLVPDGEDRQRAVSRVLWVAGNADSSVSGWDGIEHLPLSLVSEFCAVRGSGEGDRPMLERLCSTLLASVDAIAAEEVGIMQRGGTEWAGFYLPIIVTTATLFTCRFNPGHVDITQGTFEQAAFEPVKYLRFQKAFYGAARNPSEPADLGDANASRTRTVWVVSAEHLIEFPGCGSRTGFQRQLSLGQCPNIRRASMTRVVACLQKVKSGEP